MGKTRQESPFTGLWHIVWAKLKDDDDDLHGMIFIHLGDDSGFVATKQKR